MSMEAPDLRRFVDAQAPVFDTVMGELRSGRKRSHWMWYVFPQITGLGNSATSRFYAIRDLDEARAYLAHPVLGARLRECVQALLVHADRPAVEILGDIDGAKLKSCLTLFLQVATQPEDRRLFEQALVAFFSGEADRATLRILEEQASGRA